MRLPGRWGRFSSSKGFLKKGDRRLCPRPKLLIHLQDFGVDRAVCPPFFNKPLRRIMEPVRLGMLPRKTAKVVVYDFETGKLQHLHQHIALEEGTEPDHEQLEKMALEHAMIRRDEMRRG